MWSFEGRDVVHTRKCKRSAYHTKTRRYFSLLVIRAMQVDFALTGSFTLDTVFETIKGKTSMTTMAHDLTYRVGCCQKPMGSMLFHTSKISQVPFQDDTQHYYSILNAGYRTLSSTCIGSSGGQGCL